MSRELRGHGNVYLRGSTWWIQYSHRGQVYRESSESPDRKVALRLLKQRRGETSRGHIIGPMAEKVTLGDMRDALFADYALRGNRSLVTAKVHWAHLIAFFRETARALDVTTDKIKVFIESQRKAGYANGTINREIESLRHGFSLMVEARRLSRDDVPSAPHLEEAHPRRGFLEAADFARLRDALPDYLREPATFLYLTGWRKGAMRSLQWMRDCELRFDADHNIIGGTVTLQPEFSKNRRTYTLPLKGELLECIRRAWQSRTPECAYIFHNGLRPVGDFSKSWTNACRAAGLGNVLVHDMRRSCARNLVRAGVPERVAMQVTGHQTASMFSRYNIVSGADLEQAMERVSEYVTTQEAQPVKNNVIPLVKKAG
jgi:integrase